MPKNTAAAEPSMRDAVWPLKRIIPYAANARTHPPEQVSLLASILRRRGPDQRIVVDEKGIILKGHGRRLAALEAKMATFPITQRFGLSDRDKREIRLEDNQVSLLAGYDADLLRAEMSELQVMGTPLLELGFTIPQIAEYTAPKPVPGIDPNEAPPLPKKPTTREGDVWLLGRHRLLCGDSTKLTDVREALAGAKPNLMVVDPPYGVNYDPNWRQEAKLAEMTARVAIAIELMPGYVDVCVERWQKLMGAKATLDGDNRTFDEVKQARLKGSGNAKTKRKRAQARPARKSARLPDARVDGAAKSQRHTPRRPRSPHDVALPLPAGDA